MSLVQELVHRDGLKIALSGRDEMALEPVLRFLTKCVLGVLCAGCAVCFDAIVLMLFV